MSTKALKTQLLAAIAMVLVAGIALGSSTYAWFASNKTVKASGMSVSATTSEALMISDTGADGSFKTSMNLAAGNNKMNPVTITDNNTSKSLTVETATGITATPKFYKLTDANKVADSTLADAAVKMADAITANSVTANFTEAAATDYATDDMWLLYTGADASKAVNMRVVVTNTEDVNIDKALHVAIIDESGNYKNYDMGSGTKAERSYTVTANNFTTLNNGAAAKYTAYVWYEGEDSDCTTKNAPKVNTLQIELSFSTEAFA